ncbi:MAG: thioesterase family protein [Candidatus Baltobacteraceae bacterium]|jgi:acyl-CoA thioester hydrolase
MKSEGSTAPAGVPFEVVERVRWADIDLAGIIYFGAYARFIEIAEIEFYRDLGFTYDRFRKLGVFLPRVHLEFDFFEPALLDDELVLQTRVDGVGVHSVRLRIDVLRAADRKPLALAKLVAACVHLGHKKKVALPEELASALRTRLPTE